MAVTTTISGFCLTSLPGAGFYWQSSDKKMRKQEMLLWSLMCITLCLSCSWIMTAVHTLKLIP